MTIRLIHDQPHRLPKAAPPDTAIAVIGDVHGEVDLLSALRGQLLAALAAVSEAHKHLIYLGDIPDRGQDSRAALAMVREGPGRPDITQTWLLGNHEMYLRDLMAGTLSPDRARPWLVQWGGGPMVEDFGLDPQTAPGLLGQQLRAAAPPGLLEDLQALPTHLQLGEIVFAHAGVDLDLPLADQEERHLCWIREPFLSAPVWPHSFFVVHGHTIEPAPRMQPHRIGLDQGAYQYGRLTGALILGDEIHLHQAITEAPRRWVEWSAGAV